MKNLVNSRLVSARIIAEVMHGHSLSDSLATHLSSLKDPRDRALAQAICYGICRYYSRLTFILHQLLKKPLPEQEKLLQAILLVGLYQLTEMRVPQHAAVTETVNAAATLKKTWAKGLTNAILREYLRNTKEISMKLAKNVEAQTAHPAWLVDLIKQSYPTQWQNILTANNQHPPFALRMNQQKISREKYLEKLKTENIDAENIDHTSHGMIVNEPIAVEQLPGFLTGDVSVQDGAAQLAADLLMLAPQQRVLDACAAPGGKLTHLLEKEPTLQVIAIEKDKARRKSIEENLTRLQLKCELICADATDTKKWWDGKLFDRILIDAPCSGSGVIRRHPDIKLLRQPTDIKQFAKEQLHLLNALWPCLESNGLLLYATCSIFPAENVEVLRQFLSQHSDAVEDKIEAAWGTSCEFGRQILPGENKMDGFYYTRIRKP